MQLQISNSAWMGLAAGGAWGGGDFSGGMASRRSHVSGVVALAYAVGAAAMAVAVAWSGEKIPTVASFAWAVAAGCAGGAALAAFYAALAQGKMGVVAPVSAVLTAAIPVIFGGMAQGLPTAAQFAGFLCAMAGIWFISRPEAGGNATQGLGLALLSGIGFGFYLIFIHQASLTAVFWPLAVSRGASVAAVLGGSLALGKFRRPARTALGLCMVAGALDVTGNVFFVLAARQGRLDVAAVLASLYPALTVVLARIFLKERLHTQQRWGMGLALVAIVLIVS